MIHLPASSAKATFMEAFNGFVNLEKQNRDDKLQYRIGQMLYTGTGTDKDAESAIEYFEKSAKLGNVHAQYALAKARLETGGNNEQIAEAIEWMSRAAESGNEHAQYALAKLYLSGEHVQKDVAKAVDLFEKAAEQGNQFAQYQLGKLYLTDEDISKDIEKAIHWLTASAEQGNQFAQYRLGRLYLTDEYAPKDIEKAIRWLTASAEQGNQFAQYQLSKLCLMGRDVPRDRELAERWLTLSAAQGNIYARFFLEHIDEIGVNSPYDAATHLLRTLARLFAEQSDFIFAYHAQSESKALQQERANAVDLVELLRSQGEQLKRSGAEWLWTRHKGVTLRGNQWYSNYDQRGGCAIDFMREFHGMTYPEAVIYLLGGDVPLPSVERITSKQKQKKKEFALPEANSDMRRVFAYLMKIRFIDRDLISSFAHARLLYKDAEFHNAVFIGCDENGVARHAHKKGTWSDGPGFQANAEGSDPRYSFHYTGVSDTLFVFEAPVDMLSHLGHDDELKILKEKLFSISLTSVYVKPLKYSSYAQPMVDKYIVVLVDKFSSLAYAIIRCGNTIQQKRGEYYAGKQPVRKSRHRRHRPHYSFQPRGSKQDF